MKNLSYGLVVAIVLICTPISTLTAGAASGPSANGGFKFDVGDGAIKLIRFHAEVDQNGTTTGEMTFTDPGVSVRANFDCLVVNGNKAVISGQVTESSVGELIGHRILLIVEDNEEGSKAPSLDRLTWGIYEPVNRTWIPQDAEDPTDSGWFNEWSATDAERDDDQPIPGRPNEVIGCQSFPLDSYAFVEGPHGSGNIQVTP